MLFLQPSSLGPYGPRVSVVGVSVGGRTLASRDACRRFHDAVVAGSTWVVVGSGPMARSWSSFADRLGLTVFREVLPDDPWDDDGAHALLRPSRSLDVTERAWARLAGEVSGSLGLTTVRSEAVDRCQLSRPVDVVRVGPATTLTTEAVANLVLDCRWSGTGVVVDLPLGGARAVRERLRPHCRLLGVSVPTLLAAWAVEGPATAVLAGPSAAARVLKELTTAGLGDHGSRAVGEALSSSGQVNSCRMVKDFGRGAGQ